MIPSCYTSYICSVQYVVQYILYGTAMFGSHKLSHWMGITEQCVLLFRDGCWSEGTCCYAGELWFFTSSYAWVVSCSNWLVTMPDDYYVNAWHTSKGSFNKHCNFMLKCCSKKWAPQSMWKDYLTTFSVESQKQLYLESSWNTPCLTAKHVVGTMLTFKQHFQPFPGTPLHLAQYIFHIIRNLQLALPERYWQSETETSGEAGKVPASFI